MIKLKVAVLEDDLDLLKDLIIDLRSISSLEVLVKESTSQKFLEEVKGQDIDLLILDIDLHGDSKSGIDVANKLKLPVLFISGKTRDYVESIENVNLNHDFPVEYITKPASLEKLNKMIPKMVEQIKQMNSTKFVYFNFKDGSPEKINIDSIVYIETISGDSNHNKTIYFTNRKPEIIYNSSFAKLEEKGIKSPCFLKPHQSFRVNKKQITNYNTKTFAILVEIFNSVGQIEEKSILVSENSRSEIRIELK